MEVPVFHPCQFKINITPVFHAHQFLENYIHTPLGEYFRRVQARHGYAQAVVATANKIARILYTMVKEKTEYDPAKHARSSASLSKQIQSLERRLQMLKMHQAEYQHSTG